ncbi:hypothetical protein QZM35_22880 [Burkholderia sp. AU45274]|uniref:hypothetical protein n=1 Tax=Burkholderia sp. AU45274 TaxID=3059205 RepID=UPI00264ECFD1|nr:hypothetical protein [Burkholderia sp. AU45274]MDN7490560.1 hypothetical protein [Burkholderia sp. AU45274]
MNDIEMRAYVRQRIKSEFGSQAKFAFSKGINPRFVSFALTGRKSVPKAWLQQFGIEIEYRVMK